jgi:hypothetical protein
MAHQDATALASLAAPARKTARKTTARKATPSTAPADSAATVTTAAAKPAAKTAAKKTAAKTTARNKNADQPQPAETPAPVAAELGGAHQMPVLDVAAILAAVPALQTGQPQSLAAVAKALLDAKLRGKNMTATKLLKKFSNQFVLAPREKPRTVQYTPAPFAS